jgi:hypothetical protein
MKKKCTLITNNYLKVTDTKNAFRLQRTVKKPKIKLYNTVSEVMNKIIKN